jgi:hypothetical protein
LEQESRTLRETRVAKNPVSREIATTRRMRVLADGGWSEFSMYV